MKINDYIESNLTTKLQELSSVVNDTKKVKFKLYKLICKYWDSLPTSSNRGDYTLTRDDLTLLFDGNCNAFSPKFSTHSINSIIIHHEHEDLIKAYIQSFIGNCIKDVKLNSQLDTLLTLREYSDGIHYILGCLNDELMKDVLFGNKVNLGYGLGSLQVKEVKVKRKMGIDWGESQRIKKQLQAEGEEVYNSVSNPNGTKWLVRTPNKEYIPLIKFYVSPNLPNRELYSFMPTSFCNKLQDGSNPISKNPKNVDEIIHNSRIGNKDKVFAIIRHDPTYYYNTRNL